MAERISVYGLLCVDFHLVFLTRCLMNDCELNFLHSVMWLIVPLNIIIVASMLLRYETLETLSVESPLGNVEIADVAPDPLLQLPLCWDHAG